MPISRERKLTYLCIEKCSYHLEGNQGCIRLGPRDVKPRQPCPFEEVGRYWENRIRTEQDFLELFGDSPKIRELAKHINQEPF